MIFYIILGLIVGIFAGVVSYFVLNQAGTKSLPPIDFLGKKKEVLKDLERKKETYEKEITQEVQEKTQNLLNSLKNKRKAIQEESDKLDKQFDDKAQKTKEALQKLDVAFQSDYQTRREQWLQVEKNEQIERQRRIQKEISEYEQQRGAALSQLQLSYDHKEKGMTEDFLAYSAEISQKREALTKQIQEYEAQQLAIIERFKKDEEIRQQKDFYHISIDMAAQRDIAQLKGLALQFSKPEVLFKLIYEVYYKTKMEELFKRVLGENKDKGGIYKITNIKNQKVYIGKTTAFLQRWRTHAKRGCGIERIKGQLYDAMFDAGLEDFTWEIVEICDKEIQSEREKYWTNFYKADSWGFNMKVG